MTSPYLHRWFVHRNTRNANNSNTKLYPPCLLTVYLDLLYIALFFINSIFHSFEASHMITYSGKLG